MELTKLDNFDYEVLPGVIRIHLNGTNDPTVVDVMSEIEKSGGNIYLDGHYYTYLNEYYLTPTDDLPRAVLELLVVETPYQKTGR